MKRGLAMAKSVRRKLSLSNEASTIWVLTHVPPFPEACWYKGQAGDSQWTPDFVCGAVGNVLHEFAVEHPQINLRVLCGHGHNRGVFQKHDNLMVFTASAEYQFPKVETYWSLS